ncbi:RlmE family RNA methyltransferase [Ferruginivarius sediminum]|uniref:Ribosomal RNA large subunit methyltransferase E n=1 Tax=Ferruginivarius sediminum TaxID=2661937 RepID=A0A369TB22_9PROT|nr:RlmE family RNA methyltransferase [Ferruginivarius sediminum]RDD62480.1 RlmE family RNA methyltransferase [Ferruginivarius sediminum]
MTGDSGSDGDRVRRRRRRERKPAAGGGGRLVRAKGRKDSSREWLQRQLSDPYVAEAKRLGYRSRAAFKLIEIDDKYKLLKSGMRVVDLGAAPGGWCQVARERVGERGQVVGLDLLELEPLPGVEILQGDMNEPETVDRLRARLGGPADAVLSDMAPNATGHKRTDQLRVLAVVEAALDFAERVLAPGGMFLAKTMQSGGTGELAARLKREFRQVRYVKPPASRSASAETYVLATGYRGPQSTGAPPESD